MFPTHFDFVCVCAIENAKRMVCHKIEPFVVQCNPDILSTVFCILWYGDTHAVDIDKQTPSLKIPYAKGTIRDVQ